MVTDGKDGKIDLPLYDTIEEAEAEAKRATDEYNKTAKEINKNIADRQSAYKRQKEEGEAKVSAAQATASAAAASREKAAKEGKAKILEIRRKRY